MREPPIPKASDIMSRRVITLRTNMRVIDAMRQLVRYRISGAPVLDRAGKLVGVVSEFDCLRVVASGLYGQEELEDSEPLRTLMTSEVVTISPGTDVFTITQLLVAKRIRRVPVVDQAGKLVGIISRRDVLRCVHQLRERRIKYLERNQKGLYLSADDGATNPFVD